MAFSTAYALGFLLIGGWIDRVGTKIGYFFSASLEPGCCGSCIARNHFRVWRGEGLPGSVRSRQFSRSDQGSRSMVPKRKGHSQRAYSIQGANVGAFIAPIMVPAILGAYGWEEAFIVTGAIGFVGFFFGGACMKYQRGKRNLVRKISIYMG